MKNEFEKKKYRIIKEYPGSPPIGTLVEVNTYKGTVVTIYPSQLYNAFPEFWEEVKEKEYEVLAIKSCSDKIAYLQANGKYAYGNQPAVWSEEELLNQGHYNIHTVKRLSDGEVFTVGDMINGCGLGDGTKIIGFNMPDCGGISIHTLYGYSRLSVISHYRSPLFITEDNVPIYEGDEYWYVVTCSELVLHVRKCNSESKLLGNIKRFSTKQAAEEYIRKTKVIFTTEDGVDIHEGDKYWEVNTLNFACCHFEATKDKLLSYVVPFYEKRNAEEYIMRNKVLFTTEDSVDIKMGNTYWFYDENDGTLNQRYATWSSSDGYSHIRTKYFSTRKAAEEYIAKNKVLFVTEDGVDIHEGDVVHFVTDTFGYGWDSKVRPKIRIGNAKYFSTEQKAREYIEENKPQYSRKQIKDALKYTNIHLSDGIKLVNNLEKK